MKLVAVEDLDDELLAGEVVCERIDLGLIRRLPDFLRVPVRLEQDIPPAPLLSVATDHIRDDDMDGALRAKTARRKKA